jgi:hypothetical protein
MVAGRKGCAVERRLGEVSRLEAPPGHASWNPPAAPSSRESKTILFELKFTQLERLDTYLTSFTMMLGSQLQSWLANDQPIAGFSFSA